MIYNIVLNDIKNFILKKSNDYWNIIYLIENIKISNFNASSKFEYINYIIDYYPDKPWDWEFWEWLVENININIKEYIPLDMIEKYPNKWNYKKLKNITKKFFYKY